MKVPAFLCTLFCLLVLPAAHAQNSSPAAAPTVQTIQARLNAPFLILRGRYAGNSLAFDGQGDLIGSASTLPFSLSALKIQKIRLKTTELDIRAQREGMEFTPAAAKDAPLAVSAVSWIRRNPVDIVINRDPAHPEALYSSLNKVFATGITPALADTNPDFWHCWLRHGNKPGAVHCTRPAGVIEIDKKKYKDVPSQDATKPALIHHVPPKYSLAAKRKKYEGICILQIVVDKQGVPRHVRIVQPAGMGLDENAVAAVRKFRFKPATLSGVPVPTIVDISIDFRVY